ncbi:hypothetical protein DAEQUDRAFT_761110 [Daedalea quercina L-15889]|uniref:Uncharacterized protein n=1 Tax=Daedalea quercina L-15889 TaxID=1314783 RepID=A0A165UMZ9_9APHY|nr:hypothetical protein DAEQUDRAFT_761110 [Daedalea quercina L-15889]
MADPTNRATLQSSYQVPAHLVHFTTMRPGKRRASEAVQYTPAETTFNPLPYHPPHAPNAQPRPSSQSQSTTTSTSARQNSQRNRPTQNNDPTPSDPGAVFIHPPFTDFPNADNHKDGLSYNLMAVNPEWFLDPIDFISPGNDNPDAIGYPSQLEPPRGWCPQKKTKEGWPEGEEPRLRCTFCRRFYSGANAKSMWRRHVLEKHKIAMANRRDNPTGRGGRTSNKENRTASDGKARRGDDGPSTSQASSSAHQLDSSDEESEQPPCPVQVRSDEAEPDIFGAINTSSTPPLTPGGPSPSRSTLRNNGGFDSPYDPLATPAFRHSPRVIDQPWRFPSPSHPLYAKDRELPLGMVVHGEVSPMINGLDNSPLFLVPGSERKKKSMLNSPFVSKDYDRISIFEQSPARLFFDNTPLSAKSTRSPFSSRIAESPLGRAERDGLRVSSLTEATKKWQAEAAAGSPRKTTAAEGSGLLGPIELQGDDVFSDGMYNSWIDLSANGESSTRSPARPQTVAESPVVRTHPQTSLSAVTKGGNSGLMSFGSGLMDAFLSGKGKTKRVERADSSDEDSDSDMNGASYESPTRVGRKGRRAISSSWSKDNDGDTEMAVHHPRKRRRTFSGRD